MAKFPFCFSTILLLAVTRTSLAAEPDLPWSSPRSTSAPYIGTSPVTGTRTSFSRCNKVTGLTTPRGYGPDFRAINEEQPERFWQVVRGPRSSYAARIDGVPEELWRYLGGAAQIFVSVRSRRGFEVSHFGALQCMVWANNSIVEETGKEFMATGVALSPDSSNLLLAYERTLPGLHELPVTPVLLGMTPGAYLELPTTDWKASNELLNNIVNLPSGTLVWTRFSRGPSRSTSGADIDREKWFQFHPTRAYSEEQCVSWLDENDRLEEGETEPVELTGLLEGDANCNYTAFMVQYLQSIATEIVSSDNSVNEPLTVPQGLFLVVIPALWEAVISAFLLSVRLAKRKPPPSSVFSKAKWLLFELATLSVSAAEFGLLVASSIDQANWQPCHMGRFDVGTTVQQENPLNFARSISEVLNVRADVVSLECFKDPGTDFAWAAITGVVVAGHTVVLFFEFCYLSSSQVRSSVDRTVSRFSRAPDSSAQAQRHQRSTDDDSSEDTDGRSCETLPEGEVHF